MHDLIVDSFAGGGGASLGITWALGRHPDVAINHDPAAILMHRTNHPTTRHLTEDIWGINPRTLSHDRPIGLLWSSPDCRHFSRAKGSQPVKKNIRGLIWTIAKFAATARPALIICENVSEITTFGPLIPRWRCPSCHWKGLESQLIRHRWTTKCPTCHSTRVQATQEMVPDPSKKGITFKRFIGRLRNLGYDVDWRILDAASFGAATRRRRLFLVARRDGHPIRWPTPTHGDPKHHAKHGLLPWRTAAECLDWSLPCPSIFSRRKPLVEATLRRIAMGIKRYVIDNPNPYLVEALAHTAQPSSTLTTPYLVRCNHSGDHFRGQRLDQPMCTLTASRDAHGLVTPTFLATSSTQIPLFEPVGTGPINSDHSAHVATFLHRYYGESIGQRTDLPAPTSSASGHTALISAYLVKHFGGVVGTPITSPLPTVTGRGTQTQLVTANLIHFNHGAKQWSGVDEPLRTIAAGGNHVGLIYSYLKQFLGEDLPHLQHPGFESPVVTFTYAGTLYILVDIGMRMLTPRELARCQGFPEDYVLTGSKTNQVHKIGNSVSPQVAQAVVQANYPPSLAAVA